MFIIRLFFLIVISTQVLAITNIESQRLNNAEPGTSGNISFTLDGEIGESDDFTLGSSVTFIRSYTKDEWIVLFNREYSEEEGDVYSDETLIHLRHLTKHSPHWGHEVFVQYEEDLFTDLRSRSLIGGGGRYTLNANPELKTANHFGFGFYYEDEEYARTIVEKDEENVRLNLYWTYRNNLTENTKYTSTLYYQPDIQELSDTKGLWQNAITISVTSTISLRLKWDVTHDNHAPDGDSETDISYNSIIIYNF